MKKLIKRVVIFLALTLAIAFIAFLRLHPLRELGNFVPYRGPQSFNNVPVSYDKSKKTVLIMADNKLTEMFDMMAPYFLFNATEKANVYIVAEKKYPITMNKGPYVLPHFSFREIDSIKLHADVIVLPYMNDPAGQTKIEWIKNHYSDSTIILSICDGAWTAAATGIYDGKPLTAHATDFEKVKKGFPKPNWVQQASFTQSGNLFSTAGVSNAVEGSLAVIDKLFGREKMLTVLKSIDYYENDLLKEHKSIPIEGADQMSGLMKMLFGNNKKIGVLLQDGVSEFELAGIFDTYNRTLPSSIKAFILNGSSVRSKYGLTLIPTGDLHASEIDEMHVLNPELLSRPDSLKLKNLQVVRYKHSDGKYIINKSLERIKEEYGNKFQRMVKRALDFN